MSKSKRTSLTEPVTAKLVGKTKQKQDATSKILPSKLEVMITLLRRPKGATLSELMEATGWQRHSIHGTLSGTIKKKRGLPLITEFGEQGRSYRLGSR